MSRERPIGFGVGGSAFSSISTAASSMPAGGAGAAAPGLGEGGSAISSETPAESVLSVPSCASMPAASPATITPPPPLADSRPYLFVLDVNCLLTFSIDKSDGNPIIDITDKLGQFFSYASRIMDGQPDPNSYIIHLLFKTTPDAYVKGGENFPFVYTLPGADDFSFNSETFEYFEKYISLHFPGISVSHSFYATVVKPSDKEADDSLVSAMVHLPDDSALRTQYALAKKIMAFSYDPAVLDAFGDDSMPFLYPGEMRSLESSLSKDLKNAPALVVFSDLDDTLIRHQLSASHEYINADTSFKETMALFNTRWMDYFYWMASIVGTDLRLDAPAPISLQTITSRMGRPMLHEEESIKVAAIRYFAGSELAEAELEGRELSDEIKEAALEAYVKQCEAQDSTKTNSALMIVLVLKRILQTAGLLERIHLNPFESEGRTLFTNMLLSRYSDDSPGIHNTKQSAISSLVPELEDHLGDNRVGSVLVLKDDNPEELTPAALSCDGWRLKAPDLKGALSASAIWFHPVQSATGRELINSNAMLARARRKLS